MIALRKASPSANSRDVLGARTQVSRDGRNQYFGITLERAAKILDAPRVRLRTQVAIELLPPFPFAQAS